MAVQLPPKPVKYRVVNGFKFAPGFSEENIRSALAYVARPDDLFIVTYPKCGTTWMQQIVILILNDESVVEQLKTTPMGRFSPFLEPSGQSGVDQMQRPGAIKTHLPFWLQPYNERAKYIYVIRNPKDACVSFYYHSRRNESYGFDGDFHDYLKCWFLGEVEGGEFAKHVLSWWEHRNDDNVLIMHYEEMKQDIRKAIKTVAMFLGHPYSEEIENDPNRLEQIVKHSDFSFMKETVGVHFRDSKNPTQSKQRPEFDHFRKGVVGDWRSHFNEKESALFDEWIENTFSGTGLDEVWKNFGVVRP